MYWHSSFLLLQILHTSKCFTEHLLCFAAAAAVKLLQSCPILCDPMDRSTPGLPVHHQLPEFTQTHVHRVGAGIQPSHHPLSSPSPLAPTPSQHQSLFQWVNSNFTELFTSLHCTPVPLHLWKHTLSSLHTWILIILLNRQIYWLNMVEKSLPYRVSTDICLWFVKWYRMGLW